MNIYIVKHKNERYDSWEDNTIISFTITVLIAENEEMVLNMVGGDREETLLDDRKITLESIECIGKSNSDTPRIIIRTNS